MACYLCGASTAGGRRERRVVETGAAYTGWRFTKNPAINALLSGSKRGPRTYYGPRTLCLECSEKYDRATKARRVAILLTLFVVALIILTRLH
jgi:hypothetical protein